MCFLFHFFLTLPFLFLSTSATANPHPFKVLPPNPFISGTICEGYLPTFTSSPISAGVDCRDENKKIWRWEGKFRSRPFSTRILLFQFGKKSYWLQTRKWSKIRTRNETTSNFWKIEANKIGKNYSYFIVGLQPLSLVIFLTSRNR